MFNFIVLMYKLAACLKSIKSSDLTIVTLKGLFGVAFTISLIRSLGTWAIFNPFAFLDSGKILITWQIRMTSDQKCTVYLITPTCNRQVKLKKLIILFLFCLMQLSDHTVSFLLIVILLCAGQLSALERHGAISLPPRPLIPLRHKNKSSSLLSPMWTHWFKHENRRE